MDLLATVADLRTLLKEDDTTLTDDEGTVLLGLATSAIQAAAGQQLLAATESVTLMGTYDKWFDLPQRPVSAVSSVTLDGGAVTDFKRFGARLWRRDRWASCSGEPSEVAVTYTHGYEDWDDRLGFARGATLTLAAKIFANPIATLGMSIDDFRLQFGQSSASDLAGVVPQSVRATLRRQYGRRAGLASVG